MRTEIIGDATLILGDCRDILPTLTGVDAVVTDPPYGIGIDTANASKARGFRPLDRKAPAKDFALVHGDDSPFDPAALLQFKSLVLWGANNYADKLPPSSCWFSWDRKAGKAAKSDITDCELAWVRGLPFKTVRQFSHMWAGFQRDSECGEKHLHPTQKPVALFEWCLGFFPDARVILDPYMGSGPCGAACIKLGRKFIGVEISETHFNIACRRIEEAYRQPNLFIEQPARPVKNADLFARADAP